MHLAQRCPASSPLTTCLPRGLGLAITKLLLEKFRTAVVALSRSETPELLQLAEAHGQALLHFKCDVSVISSITSTLCAHIGFSTDSSGFEQAIKKAHETFQRIDSIILNAGTLDPLGKITATEVSLDDWRANFEVNFFSLISALRVTVPLLNANETEPKGRVVFVSSGAAVSGIYGWGPYNASKAAMNSLCRCVLLCVILNSALLTKH